MIRYWVLGIAAILFFLLLGCLCPPYNPYAHLFVTEKPNAADVLGTYILKRQTLTQDGSKILQGETCLIEIRDGRSCTVTNYPIWTATSAGYEFDKLVSFTDKWDLKTIGSVSTDGKDIKPYWGITFSRLEPASLTGDEPPYGLIFTYGDPDSGTVMIFERLE